MSFRQALNNVRIEGILSEINLKYNSYVKDGAPVDSIGGNIKVLVEQEVNGQPFNVEVPVYVFSNKYTKAGGINPSYESIEQVMKEYVSIAAAGDKNQADKVRITKANIRMNEFLGQSGNIVSQPRVYASFISKVTGEFVPSAEFNLEFMVSSISRVTDAEGVEVDPAKLSVQVIVPQYTAANADTMRVDLVPLVATSPSVITAIESYWEAGMCYKAHGRLNFSSRTEDVVEEVDFGEPRHFARTINTHELVISSGTQAPLDGELAFDINDIKAGMAARKQRLEDMKAGKTDPRKLTPAQNTSKGKLDLGF